MNSLQELNGFGQTALEVTDTRDTGVIFDRLYPLLPQNQVLNITSTTVEPSVGIEIEEIINYDEADVRYQVKIIPGSVDPLPGSSISWASIPAHLTLTQVDDTYTISGIETIADWDAIKNFTWTLPSDYNDYPLWFLEVSVIYYDGAVSADRSKEWYVYDQDYYYLANPTVTSSISIGNFRARLMTTNLQIDTYADIDIDKVKGGRSYLDVESELIATGLTTSVVNIDSSSSMSITAGRKRSTNVNISSTTDMVTRIEFGLFRIQINNTPTRYQLELYISHDGPLTINWGDGTTTSYASSGYLRTVTHNYPTTSTVLRTVSFDGNLTKFRVFSPDSNDVFVKQVISWADTGYLTDLSDALSNQDELTSVPAYIPNSVTNVDRLFYGCTIFNDYRLQYWDTSNITSMSEMFAFTPFNQNIGSWNVADVIDMSGMFRNNSSFNQNIGSWNISSVSSISEMFYNATTFNQNISSWNTSNVTNMRFAFSNADAFNQPIGTWNTSNVTNMERMFLNNNVFNQNIGSWNTGKVTNMHSMFSSAIAFNQNIGSWNTSKVTDMGEMFYNANSFNQDISGWDTSLVTDMTYMFYSADVFDQDISSWCVTLIPTKPTEFDTNTLITWTTAEKPVWGTCP